MDSSDFVSGASEMGSLTAHSNNESQFVGSSSGVYFINTVRQAFSKNLDQPGNSSPSGKGFPPPEDTLVGSEDTPRDKHRDLFSTTASPSVTGGDGPGPESLGCWKYASTVSAQLGNAPPLDMAKELMMAYFKVWHPLFPFLHGPTFLQAMELLYSGDSQDPAAINQPPSHDHSNVCWTTIFQCVFNLASLLRPDLRLPPESQIDSPSGMYSLLGTLSSRHDLSSLQALLAAQLYLVAKMSLRTASTVGGCILRSMLHAGLHRCPFRYKELSSHDRQLRKRIFWCAYAIDRYLSQALGLPLGIQDSDVDVCPPGACEIHFPGTPRAPLSSTGKSQSRATPFRTSATSLPTEPGHLNEGTEDQQRKRESALASYVESGKLTGRALELFHKSIVVRSIRRSSVLFLTSDVHKWWNSLPRELQGTPPLAASSSMNKPFNFGPFFTVLYHHLILLINRPFLSLGPSTAEFCSALQTCIGAARGILTALRTQVDGRQELFWPGFLSAAWMSGLVLAFACQLRQYVLSKGYQEINECLEFLNLMSMQWETARHCHSALSLLSTNIRQSAQHTSTSAIKESHTTTESHYNENETESEEENTTANEKRKPNPNPNPTTFPTANHEIQLAAPAPAPAPTESSNSQEYENPAAPPGPIQEHTINPPHDPIADTNPAYSQEMDNNHHLLFFPDGSPRSTDMGMGIGMGMGNFDLNMVDLLHGSSADFDSLFDMFGQQFPSF